MTTINSVADSRSKYTPHRDVEPATDREQVLERDIWDIRTIKLSYSMHRPPSSYIVSFEWISNQELKRQLKLYFCKEFDHWEARTFYNKMSYLKSFFIYVPPDIHIGTLTREHVLEVYEGLRRANLQRSRVAETVQTMLEYMRDPVRWVDVRPAENLIHDDEARRPKLPPPRDIPLEVLDQLTIMLEQAESAMDRNLNLIVGKPTFWNAVRILLDTGLRFVDLAHLKLPTPDNLDFCLTQNAAGDRRLIVPSEKTHREYQIPLTYYPQVVRAIQRQCDSTADLRARLDSPYIFCTERGVYSATTFAAQLRTLAPYLPYQEQPYIIRPHDFRVNQATQLLEYGGGVNEVRLRQGHNSSHTLQRYVAYRNLHLREAYRKYCNRAYQATSKPAKIRRAVGAADHEFFLPLAGGLGQCRIVGDQRPNCNRCSYIWCDRFRADASHLPALEQYASNLRQACELLANDQRATIACQRHQRDLERVNLIIARIRQIGGWDGRAGA